jgi:ParB family chromosome partitioning protein
VKKNSNVKNISLASYDDIFKTEEERSGGINRTIMEIPISELFPFANHPFKLYEGERLADMVESIKENGIIIPIIARNIDDEKYEILSGHNRVEAAKSVGLETVPVIVRENLSDDEALLIVTETNLIQRSFADLSHSERAAALAVHHEAIKSQGRRTDLINEIENLLKTIEYTSKNGENQTSSHIGKKFKTTMEKVGQEYNLSKNSVARYLRINNLIEPLKKFVDESTIPLLAAVELSYISDDKQYNLVEILQKNSEMKIDIKKAEILREFSENNKLTPKIIEDILSGISINKKFRASLPVQSLKIGGKVLSKYFKPEQKPEEIQDELFKALEFYRAHINSNEN